MESDKFYSLEEVWALRRKAGQLRDSGRFEGIRDWFLIEFALSSGLRVSELASLLHGDVCCGCGKYYVEVRRGKGGKRRVVTVAESFVREAYSYYVSWKEACSLSTAEDAPLFVKRSGKALTSRALQKAFAKCAVLSGVHRKNTHCLRHTYSTYLDIVTGRADVRLVKEQLGHSSILTTEIYLGENTPEEFKKVALEKLYALFKGEIGMEDLMEQAYGLSSKKGRCFRSEAKRRIQKREKGGG
jgi:site-specific recombinase XerD